MGLPRLQRVQLRMEDQPPLALTSTTAENEKSKVNKYQNKWLGEMAFTCFYFRNHFTKEIYASAKKGHTDFQKLQGPLFGLPLK